MSEGAMTAAGQPLHAKRKGSRAAGIDWVKVLAHIILLAGSVMFLMPFIYVLSTSLKTAGDVYTFPPEFIPDPFAWENYPDALTAMPFDVFFINTILLAVGRIAGLTLSCSLAGFAFAKLRWRGRNTLFFIVLLTLMIPTEVTLIPRYILFAKLGWVGSFAPLLVPGFFAENAFFVFLFRQFFMTMGQDLIDSARIDGCSFVGLFWRIIVPNAKPVFAVVAIYIIQNNWNSFLLPMIYLTDRAKYTLALGLRLFNEQYYSQTHLLMAASVFVVVPIVILFFFMQRYFIQGVVFTGSKG
ncbi:MAG: carbohydrate ABC transporter permease [Chloroflexota bacterium]|nr:carbohydrate ABC transporter permease [Chloroflexota bacterium]MDE2853025.1 carbohydrate ABC transporter permease [Chloroflexota bacterium]MDE2947789.1 carbohydrate ABC transporter permease [Chloroflexota bacterium]